ncbi:hypothetical protein [Pragia fontium]|uniref:hypothetical protein n=1 Tax=Pragia fontium TaxID=82985 RepID=UPI000649D337|nr:hypothetical protein [Pragia fontium]AKJ41290.1 hypothetical protein QQ39_03700 [Pragia fontium]
MYLENEQMGRTSKIRYFTVLGLWVSIGLMAMRPAVAAYNAVADSAISRVTIKGNVSAGVGYISKFIIDANTVSGIVNCGPANGDANKAWHYTLIDLPKNSAGRYMINKNLSFSATVSNNSLGQWINAYGRGCSSDMGPEIVASVEANYLTVAFPIELNFYLESRPIDNVITFPTMILGGYLRSFGGPQGLESKKYAIPIRLEGGSLQLKNSCTVNPTALVIDHGTLSSGTPSHRTSTPITYTCDSPVDATLSIDYEANGDGYLPLKDAKGVTGAVSKLTITDPQTNASGTTIKAKIQTDKTFTVSSELSQTIGNGAFTGSAWLTAVHN